MLNTMKIIGATLSLCLIFAAGEALRQKRSTCTDKYSGQTPAHTMCLTDSSNAQAVTLTQSVKDQIVQMHNEIRRNVADAADMMTMEWDDRLAAVAAKWAMQCTRGHDNNRQEPDLPGFVGQNAARSTYSNADFPWAVDYWASEITYFEYGNWTSESGHYIQEIFNKAALIGCGQSTCGSWKYFICNYYSGTTSTTPYTNGTACGSCPSSCVDGLCDCTNGPDACFNGGVKNINTCTCDCDGIWGGDDCQALNCPTADLYTNYCAQLDTALCGTNSFYRNTCPYRCNICPSET